MLTKLKNNINNTIINFKTLSTKNKALTIIGFCFMCFCMICCGVLCSKITPVYIDDVMYGDWAKHGIGYFIEKNIWHMQNFNGRTFIHMCLEMVLIFKEYLYAILMPLFLVIPFAIFFKFQNKDNKLGSKSVSFAVTISFLLFFMLGYMYINATLMWMAGGFNYIFPLFIISITYWLFFNNRLKDKTSILTIVLLFLCGATTEQYGMFTIGMVTLTLFFDLLDKIKIKKNIIRYFVPTIIGYLTIFMASGTFNRFVGSAEYASSTNKTLINLFFNNCKFTLGGQGNIIVLLIFFLTIGFVSVRKQTRYSKFCISAIPVALISMALYYTKYLEVVYVLCVTELVLLCVALCLKKETREHGKLLICGTGTFLMMSITMATGTRTSLPFMLCICIITSTVLYDISKCIKKPLLSCVSVALCLLFVYTGTYSGMLTGYSESEKYCKNLQNELIQAKDTGEIIVDYDNTLASQEFKYRYTTIFDLSYGEHQREFYFKYFDIPENVKFSFVSEKYDVKSLKCNERYVYSPIVLFNNEPYVSYATIISLGFETNDDLGYRTVWNDKYIYKFNEDNKQLIVIDKQTNETIKTITTQTNKIVQYGGANIYVKLSDYCEWLNLNCGYSEQENTYYLNEVKE